MYIIYIYPYIHIYTCLSYICDTTCSSFGSDGLKFVFGRLSVPTCSRRPLAARLAHQLESMYLSRYMLHSLLPAVRHR